MYLDIQPINILAESRLGPLIPANFSLCEFHPMITLGILAADCYQTFIAVLGQVTDYDVKYHQQIERKPIF
jgi:hypothetical protein